MQPETIILCRRVKSTNNLLVAFPLSVPCERGTINVFMNNKFTSIPLREFTRKTVRATETEVNVLLNQLKQHMGTANFVVKSNLSTKYRTALLENWS